MRWSRRIESASLFAAYALAACGTTARQSEPAPITAGAAGEAVVTPAEQARADSGRPPYTPADVRFMQNMILHHGQATVMSAWAPTHGASDELRVLAARIDVAQRDEITTMQRWLRERGQTVPDPQAHHSHTDSALMPGMLTPAQMTQLDRAQGRDFDRLFLTLMIRHHEGAVKMVEQLFATPGAGQDTDIYRIASDVHVDQVTEIDRMRSMLSAMPADTSQPTRP
ncbi:MAG TPA: DUF305 domain-containing protein [Gemmatimonadaceae bacterium]|nr:DUF305 domain-containing protein [Gemmatimonadaceae bacterium]